MKKKKGFLLVMMVGMLWLQSRVYGAMVDMTLFYDGANHRYVAEEITIEVNGTILLPEDMPPVIIEDRTFVPARAVFEAMGAEVAWNESTQEIYIQREKDIIILQIGQTRAVKNGESFAIDVAPKIINDRTMLPVRVVSEALGCTVTWDENSRLVTITEGEETVPEEVVPEVQMPASGGTGESHREDIGVQKVLLPESKNSKQVFTIQASNSIPKYQEIITTDTEIVLQLYDARKEILTDTISVTTSAYVKEVHSSQEVEDGTTITEVVFRLRQPVTYEIALTDYDTAITLTITGEREGTSTNQQTNTNQQETTTLPPATDTNLPNQVEHISYDSGKEAIALEKLELFAVSNIEHRDNYLQGQYQLVLPDDFGEIYGNGTMTLPHSVATSLTVTEEDGKTVLTIGENSIRAYTVTEDAENYYINIKNPKEVYDKVLVLDAGHGGKDPGTNGNGLVEKELTLAIASRAYELLQQTDRVKTYITRLDDSYPTNQERAALANDIGDVFLSVHMNSASPNATPNGTEALFITHATDVEGKLTSKAVATVVLKNMVNALGTNNRGLKYDTEEQTNLIVFNQTVVPAVIIETLFLSNPGDALKISDTVYQERAAQAIYESVLELANHYEWR